MLILATDKFDISDTHSEIIEVSNNIFYGIFLFEMILKLAGMGFKQYFKDSQNKIDFTVVILATIEVIIRVSTMESNDFRGGVRFF